MHKRKGGRRSPAQLKRTRNALAEFVSEKPGELMENIAKALGSTSRDLARPMSKLLKDGTVRREGEKRASRYYPAEASASTKRAARKKSTSKRKTPKRTSKKRASSKAA